MDQSFTIEPATTNQVEEMTKEQQTVVDRYREQQDAKSKPVPEQTRPKLVYSAEQRKTLELLASVNCPVAQRMGMIQSGDITA